MPDRVSAQKRSYIMSRVKSRNTGPELALRSRLHRLGFRYRTNVCDLPGKPDIVFPARRKIVFVHGCFWHGHRCRFGRLPKSNRAFWSDKIEVNRNRDKRTIGKLRRAGWRVLVVWQCTLRDPEKILRRVVEFLERID